jgi:hypothetical protein
MKDALSVKPADSPVLDIVLNPARVSKLVQKDGENPGKVEKALGTEDRLVSALSLNVAGGKELSVRLAVNLRLLPRAVIGEEVRTAPSDSANDAPAPVEKK